MRYVSFILLLIAPPAFGVIVSGTDTTHNAVAPANFSFWNNIGYTPSGATSLSGSGIYLGDGWVLTAFHVQGGVDGGYTWVIPKLNNGQDAVFTPQFASERFLFIAPGSYPSDLALFRLNDDPLLHMLPKVQFGRTPSIGTHITVIGAGVNRAPNPSYWRATTPNWTDVTGTPSQNTANRQGYYYANGFAKRWGTNDTVAMPGNGPSFTFTQTDGNGNVYTRTQLFGSVFNSGIADEAQVAPGDSGGGVFVGNRLVGLNLYKGDEAAQPDNSAAYGNSSFFADLYYYVDQIASITKFHPSIDGDANLDGVVDSADFKIFYDNYQTGTVWTQGDFNLDGRVDFIDFQRLELNYGMSSFPAVGSESVSPAVAGVPEPGTLALLGMSVTTALLTRRRR